MAHTLDEAGTITRKAFENIDGANKGEVVVFVVATLGNLGDEYFDYSTIQMPTSEKLEKLSDSQLDTVLTKIVECGERVTAAKAKRNPWIKDLLESRENEGPATP